MKPPLTDLYKELESIASTISFEEELIAFGLERTLAFSYLRDDNYFKILAAYAKYANIRHALELGTYAGASALATAKFAKCVTTCDITLSKYAEQLNSHTRILPVEFKSPDDCLAVNFTAYDMIFIDIGDHNGYYESKIHDILTATYNGVVFYDDINWGMRRFWDTVKQEKQETDAHGCSGFGLVKYETIR